jgi:hypothetical protein
MVPMNQPVAALNMLNEFISGGVLSTKNKEEPQMLLQN